VIKDSLNSEKMRKASALSAFISRIIATVRRHTVAETDPPEIICFKIFETLRLGYFKNRTVDDAFIRSVMNNVLLFKNT